MCVVIVLSVSVSVSVSAYLCVSNECECMSLCECVDVTLRKCVRVCPIFAYLSVCLSLFMDVCVNVYE